MELKAALAELRIILDDAVQPYGWTDALLTSYIKEGQDRFCEDTGLFTDATTYSIVTEVGKKTYTLPTPIIQIYEVWSTFGMLSHIERPQNRPELIISGITGPPAFWSADYIPGSLWVYPTPDIVRTLNMRVWRRASPTLFGTGTLEVESRGPIEYAAARAYGIHDKELGNKGAAEAHYAKYRDYVVESKRQVDRISGAYATLGCNPSYQVRKCEWL